MRDDVAAYHANRMHVGETIGVVAALPGGFVHKGANCIVRQHQAPELLTHQLGQLEAAAVRPGNSVGVLSDFSPGAVSSLWQRTHAIRS